MATVKVDASSCAVTLRGGVPMKLPPLAALVLATLCLFTSGCKKSGVVGNGHVITESRSVDDFGILEIAGGFDVTWKSGPPALSLTAEDNVLPHIKTEAMSGKLKVRLDNQVQPSRPIKLAVSSSALRSTYLAGAVSLAADGIEGPSLDIISSGAVTVEARGSTGKLKANLDGASTLKAHTLDAKDAVLTLMGAATADVAVTDKLKVTIVGAGFVTYTGNPAIDSHRSLPGSIRRR